MNKDDCRKETKQHIRCVRRYMWKIIIDLIKRSFTHDRCKLSKFEKPIFDKYTPLLKRYTYGSKEYSNNLANMKIALDHHYKNSRHHPEHFENGVHDMNLVDMVEMICDWKAATKRHLDGNIYKSIEVNRDRFRYDSGIEKILLNTVDDCLTDSKLNMEKK